MRQWSPTQYLRGQLDLIDWLGEQDAKDRKTKNSDASGHHAKSAPLQAQKAPRHKARSASKTRAKTTRQAVTLSSACQIVPCSPTRWQGSSSKTRSRTWPEVTRLLNQWKWK